MAIRRVGGRRRIRQLLRDMNVGTQHVIASPPVIQATGRELAGLAEDEVGSSSA